MKKLMISLLGMFLLTACAAPAAAASPSPSASASAKPSASSAPASVHTSQTAPVTLSVDGVISDLAMSTITLRTGGTDVSYLKSDTLAVDGIMARGTEATVSYQVDGTDNVAVSVVVNSAPHTIKGTISDQTMNTITLTASAQNGNQDILFTKNENCVEDDSLLNGAAVIISYDGELDGDPDAYAVLMDDASDAITVQGVVEDEAMSTITIRSAADGSERSFTKSDSYTVDGNTGRGMQVIISAHSANGEFVADSVIGNSSPRTVNGKVTALGMSTITITPDSSASGDVSFLKMDDCVTDDGIAEGDSVEIHYEGELDGSPNCYAILKN